MNRTAEIPPARVIATANFQREAKPLLKRYRSLKQELLRLAELLRHDSTHGEPLGLDCYKIRLAIASKGRGKSGGARVISYRRVVDPVSQQVKLYLLTIYDKSETASIGREQIERLMGEVGPEAE